MKKLFLILIIIAALAACSNESNDPEQFFVMHETYGADSLNAEGLPVR